MQIDEGDIPLLFTRLTHRPKKNTKVLAELVTMKLEDFEKFLIAYNEVENMSKKISSK